MAMQRIIIIRFMPCNVLQLLRLGHATYYNY